MRLQIEENNHKSKTKSDRLSMEAKANLVEQNTSKKRKHKGNGQKQKKSKKFKGSCFNYNKPNLKAKD